MNDTTLAFYYFFYFLDPLMTFFMGIMYMVSQSFTNPSDWTQINILVPTLINSSYVMAGQFVFYFTIVLTVDWYRTGVYKRTSGGDPMNATSYATLAVHADAENHAEKVKRSENYPRHPYYIKSDGLAKIYPNGHLAVSANTFGVPRGQVLGLLGPNGAGKSTTFSMMSLQQSKTTGRGYILGRPMQDADLENIGKNLSICP